MEYSSGKLDVLQYGTGTISDSWLRQEYHSNQSKLGCLRVYP